MPKFTVSLFETVRTSIVVDAPSQEKAEEWADDNARDYMSDHCVDGAEIEDSYIDVDLVDENALADITIE